MRDTGSFRGVRCRRLTLVEVLLVVAVVLLVLGALIMWFVTRQRESWHRTLCRGNFYCFGVAALMYSGDFNRYFMLSPFGGNSWQPLGTIQYMPGDDSPVWACPSARVPLSDCSASNYLYFGSGLTDDVANAPGVVLGYDASGNHRGNAWMNALFADGHAEGAVPDGSKGWNRNDVPPARPPPPKLPAPTVPPPQP